MNVALGFFGSIPAVVVGTFFEFAILYSLVATCEQHRINPQAYLEAAFAEAISGDNATEWLPTVWFDRVRTKGDVEHPPRDPVTNQPADDVT